MALPLSTALQKQIKAMYPPAFAKEIAKQMGLPENEWKEMQEELVTAATHYLHHREEKNKSLTPKAASKALNGFALKADILLEAWRDLLEDVNINRLILMEGKKVFERETDYLKLLEEDAKGLVSKNTRRAFFFEQHLQLYRDLAKHIIKERSHELGMSPQFALERLVFNMEPLFFRAKKKFTHGKYYKEFGYKSECLDIVCMIMDRLDKSVTRQNIADKIDECNRLKKNPDWVRSFFSDPKNFI